jgi:hypothetical protein
METKDKGDLALIRKSFIWKGSNMAEKRFRR